MNSSPQGGFDESETEPLSLRALLVRVTVGLMVLLIGVAALSLALHEPISMVSELFVSRFGLVGVFVGILVLDSSPVPMTHEPILLFAWSGGVPYFTLLAVASTASVCAGTIGWVCGRHLLRRWGSLQRVFDRYRVTEFMEHYGVWAVAVAALLPFPFAVATWTAGAIGMPWRDLMLGSLVRIPKVLFYLTLIVLGWTAGS